MNIFILDRDPVLAAQQQNNKHVVKMVLEATQLLSSAIIINGGSGPYKLTHRNHPCTIWASKNRSNFSWLIKHGLALAEEYTFRYEKRHKCENILTSMKQYSTLLPEGKMTEFVLAMPEQYKNSDPVVSYRNYYLGEKASFSKWTKREVPQWFITKKV